MHFSNDHIFNSNLLKTFWDFGFTNHLCFILSQCLGITQHMICHSILISQLNLTTYAIILVTQRLMCVYYQLSWCSVHNSWINYMHPTIRLEPKIRNLTFSCLLQSQSDAQNFTFVFFMLFLVKFDLNWCWYQFQILLILWNLLVWDN